MKRPILLVLLVPFCLEAQRLKLERKSVPGYESIKASDLQAHLTFLAAPELEGRETTFRGQKIAAQYIASMFRKFGLKPVGIDGSYFQPFDLIVSTVSPESKIAVESKRGTKRFSLAVDFLPTSVREASVTGQPVFIGYTDTYLDSTTIAGLAGKITMVFAGRRENAKDTLQPGGRRFFFSRTVPGSLATLVILNEPLQGSIGQWTPFFNNVLEKGSMQLPDTVQRRAFGPNYYLVSSALATEIVGNSGLSLAQLRDAAATDSLFKPVPLTEMTVSIESRIAGQSKRTENVIGLLEGTDPVLKNEVVVVTAHYDHVGIGPNGTIYHGADDDGSGTSVLLEMAEAFAQNPNRPKRSILFMAVTAEEKGLLGSEYYVRNPIIPLEKTVANINIDMVGRLDEKYQKQNKHDYVYVIGSDKISTSFDSLLKAGNQESENLLLDYTYNDDNDPNQFYRRSDHYNFAKHGIPVVFFFTGIHEDYHRPTDTVDKILFDKTARIARLAYYFCWKVAQASPRTLRKSLPPAAH
ncbi:MAG TPA: M28 family peptidase [Bacteroidota bacterium]|nr:M28 family peptidase [Bacteroidota bacterium]